MKTIYNIKALCVVALLGERRNRQCTRRQNEGKRPEPGNDAGT